MIRHPDWPTLLSASLFALFSALPGVARAQECLRSVQQVQNNVEAIAPWSPILGQTLLNGLRSESTSIALKTEEELEAFFKSGKEDFKKYEPVVREASKTFQVPEPFLACLASIESSYKPNLVSKRGAKGIMQFTSGTLTAINQVLDQDDDLGQVWADFPWHSFSARIPHQLLDDDLYNPTVMIPTGALLLRSESKKFFGEIKGMQWSVSQMLVLVAAYNQGEPTLQRHCGKGEIDPDECIKDLDPATNHSAYRATWNEMNKVKACMASYPPAAR